MGKLNSREKTIIKASKIAIWGNGFLAVAKISVGLLAGSMAVIADGIDSGSDILTSIVKLVTAHIIAHPPDLKYPYGSYWHLLSFLPVHNLQYLPLAH